MSFRAFSGKEAVFCNFFLKSSSKRQNMVVWVRVKAAKFWPNRWFFEQTTMFWCFDEFFSQRLQKVAQFVRKHEKSWIWQKLCNFSNKQRRLCISINFSGETCKKCLISWESTKNYRFGQNYATFSNKLPWVRVRVNPNPDYHNLTFRWTFQDEVAESASFCEKERKIIDLAKSLELFEQTTMSLHFDELFRKKLQKVPHFVKKHEKPWIWLKLWHFFEQTAMSLHFDELFRKKLQKLAHFVRKHVKPSIWPKLFNFSNKLPCLCISMNFSGKSCKKCPISWKSAKNHRFGQNYAFFRTNCHVFPFRWTFQEKVAKSASLREKAQKIINLAKTLQLFLTNYHVLVFRWTFKQEVAESGSIREKARKFIDLAKTLQLFEQTTMSLHFDQLFRKKLQKVPHFVKTHEKPSI